MLKNTHVIVAMLVAPILAIFAWFATDMIVGETPFEPVPGETYKLVEKPNCRWESGVCGLKNGNFEIEMTTEPLGGEQLEVTLVSSHPLVGVQFAVFKSSPETIDRESKPVNMQSLDNTKLKWGLMIDKPVSELTRFRLAVKASESLYFGEVGTTFLQAGQASYPNSES